MAIKNFIKKGTYSSISNLNVAKDKVDIQLTVYEDDSKENKFMAMQYSVDKTFPVVNIDKYVDDLSKFTEAEGLIFLFSNNKNEKQGFHEFTQRSVKGEKNSYNILRESSHKESPRFVKIKDVVYEYNQK